MRGTLRTDIGRVRKSNEDAAWMNEEKGIFAVADGMGGHLAGEVASAMAIAGVQSMAKTETRPDVMVLESMVREANQSIAAHAQAHPECSGMGTTLSTLWENGRYVFIAHVGDSRIYRFRRGRLEQITRDHSLVAELVRGGIITEAEARVHPRRNIITRALGTDGYNEPDILIITREETDLWLLCTDGLHGMVSNLEIEQILGHQSPEAAADALMQAALDAGGTDNVTFIICGGEEEMWKQG
ncbi:MAG: Stp1/IreP family PP2C-type Ser/Thr phosphatase [Clostridia bacterium]|nr:Stp1/IreP family PP2C-type Ser/Thr phosphatase [Clostridia bacterium]